jgi:hypothetical protein
MGRSVSSGDLAMVWAKSARERIAAAPKRSDVSLRHLASYARIAIHLGEFSLNGKKWRSARAIKLRNPSQLG